MAKSLIKCQNSWRLNSRVFFNRYAIAQRYQCYTSHSNNGTPQQQSNVSNQTSIIRTKLIQLLDGIKNKKPGRLEKMFEKKLPTMYRFMDLYKGGTVTLMKDVIQFYDVKLDSNNLEKFSREQLDSYRQVPADLRTMWPVFLLSMPPGFIYFVMPLAYKYPKQLLARQFWSPELQLQIGEERLIKRLQCYPKILRFMQKEAARIRDKGLKKVFLEILWKLEQGQNIEVEELLDVKEIFTTGPLAFDALHRHHLIYMERTICQSWHFPHTKHKLSESAHILLATNRVIGREGFDKMSLEDLQQACILRGLMTSNLNEEELKNYLTKWVTLSQNLKMSSQSLLLHSHVFFALNHPNNVIHYGIAKQQK